jgi:hypothetical protein
MITPTEKKMRQNNNFIFLIEKKYKNYIIIY